MNNLSSGWVDDGWGIGSDIVDSFSNGYDGGFGGDGFIVDDIGDGWGYETNRGGSWWGTDP